MTIALALFAILQDSTQLLPLKSGHAWTYERVEGSGTSEVQKTVTAVPFGETTAFEVTDPGMPGLMRKMIFRASDSAIELVQVESIRLQDPIPWIKFPVKPGEEWKNRLLGSGGEDGGTLSFSVGDEEEVEVPAGKFKARRLRVLGEIPGGPTLEITNWLAVGAGEVKRRVVFKRSGRPDSEETFSLKKFEPAK